MCAAERVQSLVTWWCAFDRRGTKEPSGEEAEEEFFNDRYQVGHIFFEENKGVDSISSSNKESHDFDGASQEQGSERLSFSQLPAKKKRQRREQRSEKEMVT